MRKIIKISALGLLALPSAALGGSRGSQAEGRHRSSIESISGIQGSTARPRARLAINRLAEVIELDYGYPHPRSRGFDHRRSRIGIDPKAHNPARPNLTNS